MVVEELKLLQEFESKNLTFDDEIFFTKDTVLIQRGLLQVFKKNILFDRLVKYIKKGNLSFDLREFAGKDYEEFIHVFYALQELGVIDMQMGGDRIELQLLQREFFGKRTWRRKTKVLFAGITAYRTMKKLKRPFEVVFDISRGEKKLYDVGVLTDQKCLFFLVGHPEKKLTLSVPYEVYSLISPASIRYLKDCPNALNVLRVKGLVEKFFSQSSL